MRDRRTVLKGMLAGGVVIGWSRTFGWVTEAQAGPIDELPPLDGEVRVDPQTLEDFADDFGHILHRVPAAVLIPGSVDDIVAIVRFARQRGLQVAANGQAGTDDQRESHSQFGNAQVRDGIAVDVKPLSTIFSIDETARIADIGAGARWSDLFDATEAFGLAPATMTDFMHLSIGGTLSVGGIGGHMFRNGAQVDNVVELEVVTGAGDRVICSETENRELFDAVRAGCGQFAIVVRAKLRLEPAFDQAMVFNLFYDDIAAYIADQSRLVDEARFDYLEGQIPRRADDTGWRYMIEAVKYWNDGESPPDPGALLAGLQDDRSSLQTSNVTYREWQFRVDAIVSILKVIGFWETPHPWIDLFIPRSVTATFVGDLFARLTTADLGLGLALLSPIDTTKMRAPLFRVPKERMAFHLGLLRFPPGVPEIVSAMLEQNRQIYDSAVAVGARRYVIGAIPNFTRQDWRRHFQPQLGRLTRAKRIFDPDNVLTPGFGIF